MACSISYALKQSSIKYAIHFSLTTSGTEEAVIPGNCKVDMGKQIIDYVCKLMGIADEEDIYSFMEEFIEQVENLKLEKGLLQDKKIGQRLAEPALLEDLQNVLKLKYKDHTADDEIDETIFFTDTKVFICNQILTPIKFTPFKNQAVANFRYLRSPSDTLFSNQYGNDWNERVQNVRISASLKDAIKFPSQSARKETQSRAKLDSLNEFSLMYQWLKECIDQIELTEGTIKTDSDLLITHKLDTSYCRNSSADSISYLSETQKTVKSSHLLNRILC